MAILTSGIFVGNALKGHARHKKNYPIDLGDLIYFLVQTQGRYLEPRLTAKRFIYLYSCGLASRRS